MNRLRLLLIILLLTAGAGGYWTWQQQNIGAQNEASIADESPLSSLPDKAMSGRMASNYPHPVSVWKNDKKAFYGNLLGKDQFDVLVVPFQVQDYAFDHATRVLMAAHLALAIETEQHVRIPDPFLVDLALGNGERRFDQADIYRLADQSGVNHIIWGYVGHDRNHHMTLTLRSLDRSSDGFNGDPSEIKEQVFTEIEFSNELPPIEVYQGMLPKMLAGLDIVTASRDTPEPDSSIVNMEIAASPLEMTKTPAEPARDAYLLQLLAELAPVNADHTRKRLAAKSLLAVYALSPESPSYRLLKARALMLLGDRPAAIKALGQPQTPEEKALLAALNGNLTEIGSFAEQIPFGLSSVIAKTEQNNLAMAYGSRHSQQAAEAAKTLDLPGQIWPLLLQRSFNDRDQWFQPHNIDLKAVLDEEFPLTDFSAEALVRGAAILGDADKLEAVLDTSVLTHIRKVLEGDADKWCCRTLEPKLTAWDYLRFIESIATDNIMRRANFYTNIQSQPQKAMAFLSSVETNYNGHPQFALARAQAELALAGKAEQSARKAYLSSAASDAFNALYWEQGQSHTSIRALDTWVATSETPYLLNNPYVDDYPIMPQYPTWEYDGLASRGILRERAELENATLEVGIVDSLHKLLLRSATQQEADELLHSIVNRFQGSTERAYLLAEDSRKRNDIPAVKQYYQENIRVSPNVWESYGELAKLLFADGDNQQAFDLVMSYPEFSAYNDANRVKLSNSAYSMGSMFYWIGDFTSAAPLYKISADLETGSEASITSDIRLKLMAGDFAGALQGTLWRNQRYGSSYGYRDYLGMLHATGHSAEAWNAFNLLLSHLETPHIWETALVGQQMEGLSLNEIAQWAQREPHRNAGRQFGYAAMHVLRAAVTDRMPSAELPSLLAAVDRPVWKVRFPDGVNRIFRGSYDGNVQMMLGPQADENMAPGPLGNRFPKEAVKSDLVYFAEGYRAIRLGEFAMARATFQEASSLFDMSSNYLGYMLPYFAYAAAKSGDVAGIETVLAAIPFDRQQFDFHLAKAILSGISGHVEESMQHLNLSLHRRPYTENRPLYTEYQYAEICEWLFEATANDQYRIAALTWAKKNQILQPWYGWPYAMEAGLTRNKQERRKAIAMAYYLDRNSERLAKLPKSEIDAAYKLFGNNNPFKNLEKHIQDRPV